MSNLILDGFEGVLAVGAPFDGGVSTRRTKAIRVERCHQKGKRLDKTFVAILDLVHFSGIRSKSVSVDDVTEVFDTPKVHLGSAAA